MVETETVSGKPENFETAALKIVSESKDIQTNSNEEPKSKKRPRTEGQ